MWNDLLHTLGPNEVAPFLGGGKKERPDRRGAVTDLCGASVTVLTAEGGAGVIDRVDLFVYLPLLWLVGWLGWSARKLTDELGGKNIMVGLTKAYGRCD